MGFVSAWSLVASKHFSSARSFELRRRDRRCCRNNWRMTSASAASGASPSPTTPSTAPLLVRAARGEAVPRPPVWVMRQAGRHMAVYRELSKRHPSFRERSEVAELSTEISLQPYRAYRPDGVILFSDILTPLPGMGVPFDIPDKGPVIDPPIRGWADVERMHPIDPASATPFVRETLQTLRRQVDADTAVLGFVGAPWTMLTYCIEGGGSKSYSTIKKMAFSEPQLLHALLGKMADNIAIYAAFQIESGADAVQLFDSWAGQLSPVDFDEFAAPYQRRVIEQVKRKHPQVPLILYISQGSPLLERMRDVGADVISVDWTVNMDAARARLGAQVAVQGNVDPACLLGSKSLIRERVLDTIRRAGSRGHIVNLGHGVLPETPEENVMEFFRTVQNFRYS